MQAAGAVEFALAFALMWTPLVRRVAAIMLAGMFVSAVLEFGKIDLIGHTLIVVVLLGIIGDRGEQSETGAASVAGAGRLCRRARRGFDDVLSRAHVLVRHVAHLT